MTSPIRFDDRYEERDQLRDQLRQLLRYRLAIVLGIVLGLLGGVLLVTLRAGSFTSTAEVLVRSKVDPFSTYGVSIDNQLSMGTERQIALSAAVAVRAAKSLGEPARGDALLGDLRVINPTETQVLRFEYTAGNPNRSARVTNAFAAAYLADRGDRTRATAERMTGELQQQIDTLHAQEGGKSEKPGSAAAAARRDQLASLQKRMSDIRSYDTSGGDIVRLAVPPTRPAGPGPFSLLGLGLLVGVLLGIVFAWLRSALEPRPRSVGEVEVALGAPVLGILPAPAPGGDGALLEVGRGDGGRAEAYRTLAFRLRRGDGRTPGRTLLVVSPKRGRGAEAAAVNLAAAFAESGDDVLLVDGTADAPGLAGRLPLTGDDSAPEGRVVVDAGTAGEFALFPGRRDAADGAPTAATVTGALPSADSGKAAFVIARSPLDHTDGLAVAARVDGVLVVGDDGTRRDDLKRLRELIGCAGGRIVGAVLDTGPRNSRPSQPKKRGKAATPVAVPGQHTEEKPAAKKKLSKPQGSSAPDDTVTASR